MTIVREKAMNKSLVIAALIVGLVSTALAGCAHRDKAAPCSPLSYAPVTSAAAGPWDEHGKDPCGLPEQVNDENGATS